MPSKQNSASPPQSSHCAMSSPSRPQRNQNGSHSVSGTIHGLPEELFEYLVKLIIGTSNLRLLDSRALCGLKDAYALCSNNSRLYGVLRRRFEFLILDSHAPTVSVKAIARITRRSLKHLVIDHHDCGAELLSEIVSTTSDRKESIALKSLHLSTHYPCWYSAQVPMRILRLSAPTLRYLHLEGKLGNLDDLLPVSRLTFPQLRYLCIFVKTFRHHHLTAILSAASGHLKHLRLRSLKDRSITDETLASIGSMCSSLQYVELEGLTNCSAVGVSSLAVHLGETLRHLHYTERQLQLTTLSGIAASCPNLHHLGLKWDSSLQVSDILQPFRHRRVNLQSLNLTWDDLNNVPNLAPLCDPSRRIRELQLDHMLSPEQISIVCGTVGTQLKVLNVKLLPFDASVRHLGVCRNLEKVTVQIKRFNNYGHRLDSETQPSSPSPEAVQYFLRKAGAKLKFFSWFSDVWWFEADFESCKNWAVRLGKNLLRYCKELQLVHLEQVGKRDRQQDTQRALEFLGERYGVKNVFIEVPPSILTCLQQAWNVSAN